MFKIIFWRYDRYLGEETAMPYSLKHKRDTRDKILESARRLFNKRGFSEVSIDEIMENAGLTRGGFYRHFRDKDELYAEAVRRFLCTDAPKPWQPKTSEAMALDRAAIGCHARQRCSEGRVSRGIGKLIDIFLDDLDAPQRRERALALAALCIGGIVAPKCVDDPTLADRLRRAAHREALRIGGWSHQPPHARAKDALERVAN
jgi:TetR/AcrR family transcriptional repressor of nem operon